MLPRTSIGLLAVQVGDDGSDKSGTAIALQVAWRNRHGGPQACIAFRKQSTHRVEEVCRCGLRCSSSDEQGVVGDLADLAQLTSETALFFWAAWLVLCRMHGSCRHADPDACIRET